MHDSRTHPLMGEAGLGAGGVGIHLHGLLTAELDIDVRTVKGMIQRFPSDQSLSKPNHLDTRTIRRLA